MSQNSWFVLKSESQLNKLKSLLKEIPLVEMSGESIFLRLGYKVLTPADKETYAFMKDLTLLSRYKFGSDDISPSLDYLATCLGTNPKTQSERISNLEKYGLVVKKRRKFQTTIYLVNTQPLPDSTFVHTLSLLIRRKKVLDLLSEYKLITDSFEKSAVLKELKSLSKNPFYKKPIKNITKINELIGS
jgi:hypothetical protein